MIPAEIIGSIEELYERGLVLDALRSAEAVAPLHQWTGVAECILAHRIAANAGAPRLSMRLIVRARRADATHPQVLAYYGYEVLAQRGPLALWKLLREWDKEPPAVTPQQQAELLALKALAAMGLRDFLTADRLLNRGESLHPSSPWIRLQRAHLLDRLDRVEEALEVANSAQSLHPHPFFRPAVQLEAQLLQELDRDEDAIELLAEANSILQNCNVATQLYSILSDNGRYREAEPVLERFFALAPLLEPAWRKWGVAQRARVAYHQGRRKEAMDLAATLDDSFHKAFRERLAAEGDRNFKQGG
jgi:tetratricopeptide (TPR) repeat protein